MSSPLRVAVVGAGAIGGEHVARVSRRISGAEVSAIVEPDAARAATAAALAPGAQTFSRVQEALDAGVADAIIVATPGHLHAPVLTPALQARMPILCEKPLTQDSESSLAVLEQEQRLDRPHIQVGFMRRFDTEYAALRRLIESGESGDLVMLRCVHRNPSVPPPYTQQSLINDSVVHEFDVAPWLAGSAVRTVEVKYPRRNALTPDRLREPILVLMELQNGVLVDVEMNVSVQFGYQVATEAVFEKGIARIGQPAGLQHWQDARMSVAEHASFGTRFAGAFDTEVQRWVDAVRAGTLVDGPNAWDGYLVSLSCEAGVRALDGGIHAVDAPDRPAFYS